MVKNPFEPCPQAPGGGISPIKPREIHGISVPQSPAYAAPTGAKTHFLTCASTNMSHLRCSFHFAFGMKGQQTSIDLRPLRRTAEPIGNQTGGAAGVWIGLMTPGLAGMGTATGVAWGVGNPVFATGPRCEDFIPNGSNPGIFCWTRPMGFFSSGKIIS